MAVSKLKRKRKVFRVLINKEMTALLINIEYYVIVTSVLYSLSDLRGKFDIMHD